MPLARAIRYICYAGCRCYPYRGILKRIYKKFYLFGYGDDLDDKLYVALAIQK